MQLVYLKPKNYIEVTAADRLTNYDSVSIDDNGLEFYETDTGILYRVCLGSWIAINSSGAVTSVFGRVGAVVAQSNDYTWAQINKGASSIADITTRSHTLLTDIGTNTHAQIDAAIGLNTTHRTSDGSDHGFIDQSVISAASPTFVGTNFTSIPDAALVNDKVNVAGDTMSGQLLIDGGADQIQLIVQANATQTANLTEWQASGSSILMALTGDGKLGVGDTPTYPLDVMYGGSTVLARFWRNDGAGNSTFEFGNGVSYTKLWTFGHVASSFRIVNENLSSIPLYIKGTLNRIGLHTTSPAAALHVNSTFDQIVQIVRGYSTQTSSLTEWQNSAGTALVTIAGTGGMQIGTPTGGDKGLGTINVAGDIYKNNTAYTNPDYVLEYWATGKIEKKNNSDSRDYKRMTLQEIEAHIIDNHRLPGIGDRPTGIFNMADIVLEKIEELFTYLIDHDCRLEELEQV